MVEFHDEIRQRLGMLPNLFRLTPENREVSVNLWNSARSGYLDNPLPSLFKERLFVWLSHFCEVRYCVVRHAGFLVGLGNPGGDGNCPPQSVDEVLRLLDRTLPHGSALQEHDERCAAFSQPLAEMPPPGSELEWSIFACATHVFLQTPDAPACQAALTRALGAPHLQHLLVFLAFVRTAHYWTRLQPDLALEEDALFLLETHQRLRQRLLGAPAAARAEAAAEPSPAAVVRERERNRERNRERETPVADGTPENERRRRQELADSRLLHDISIELIGEQDIGLLYGKITSAAALLLDAPCATMQMLCEEQEGIPELQLLGHHGIPQEVAAAWQRVRPGGATACAAALSRSERVIVPDIDQFGLVTDADALAAFRRANIRSVQSTPLKTRAGTVVGMISTHWHVPHMPSPRELHLLDILARQAADLIERARVEQALRESEERLRESDRMKDQFLAILAHELRNPLAPICNSLELLRLSDMAADTGQLLGMLDRQVGHIVHLVDDLLETSRISRGEIELKREPLELADVLHTAVDASKPLIENGRHRLELRLPEDPVRVHGDAVRLTQVFTNLLNNAAKYTPDGGRISLSVQPEGENAAISVCDNGIGIAPEQLPRLFQMFARLNPGSDGRRQGGLGIGLSLAQRLAQMHGGGIEAHSGGLGQGSRFTVRLPLAPYSPPPASPDRSTAIAGLDRLRILIVDDNRDAGDSLAMLLRILGAEVRVECDGGAALAALNAYRPSAALLDLGMPGMDGYEVARRIRADRRHDDVMLVAITGWSQQQDRERTRAAGFHHHLIKPLDTGKLIALLSAGGRA